MKIDAGNIFRLLQPKPRGLSARDLLLAMGHKQKKKAFLRKVLRAMAQEGWITKDDNRYQLTSKARENVTGLSTPKPKPEIQERATRKPQKESNQAAFLADQTLAVIGTGERLTLTKESEKNFLPGDLLGFTATGEGQAKITTFFERKAQIMLGLIQQTEDDLTITPFSPGFDVPFRLMGLDRHPNNHGRKALLQVLSFPEPRASFQGFVDEGFLEGMAYRKILEENNIEIPFPKQVQQQAESFPDPQLEGSRVDLRSKPFVTIDGADAKDFDDAIYAEATETGFTLWVAIADVSEYVTNKSPLDKEAQRRGTSVYLPQAVVPMLPEALSNELCSLQAGVPRLTLCAEMEINFKGEPIGFKVYESLIQVKTRLTYGQVDQLFETDQWSFGDDLKERMLAYKEFAQVLRNKRQTRGAINFSLPEVDFEFNEINEVTGVHQTFQSDAMKLIEQFMLEANENVGQYCEDQRLSVLWRNHADPLPAKVEQLKSLLWNQNIRPGNLQTGQDFNRLLKEAASSENPVLVEISLLRTLSLAGYGNQREGHFGLAATHYLHFTSPIRRYPDLIVHRAIKEHLAKGKPQRIASWLGEHTSNKEQQAKTAERSAVKLKRMSYMSRQIGQSYTARISGLSRQGAFCQIKEPFVEGYLPFAEISEDRYHLDEKSGVAQGRSTKRTLKIGQSVEVLLTGIDLRYSSLNFTWIDWPTD